ncbi:hypothetical protein [Xylanibacter ruminicola]|uniref:Uncharacterized protein n=1 Tax=Xylanibacter ruminicola TaxID=839 RepID=A0A1M6U4P8_XYLRU|nr:hypothetical protein [Xylanibacter ruminicola]SHK64133.1 hypothetical protein SAMN05216463_10815 [Xylanibacter ruminicola]
MNTAINFLLRDKFQEWLIQHGKEKTYNQYFRLDKLETSGNLLLYYDIIASFLYYDERIYAYTVLNKWEREVKNKVKRNGESANLISYLNRYKEFIHEIIRKEDIHQILNGSNKIINSDILASIRKDLNQSELAQIDGMDSLLEAFDYGEKDIIKLAIESSFFFDKDMVEHRLCEIANKISNNEPLPARKSKKFDKEQDNIWYYCEDDKHICKIERDGNGNALVCQMINYYTGYNLGSVLKKKPFKNFIISHLWGGAVNPFYFTNLWNIVLVPAWANHLLDKDIDDEDSLASKLKATFMCICSKYYNFKKMSKSTSWKVSNFPEIKGQPKRGNYKIQTIKPIIEISNQMSIEKNSKVGKIAIEQVKI